MIKKTKRGSYKTILLLGLWIMLSCVACAEKPTQVTSTNIAIQPSATIENTQHPYATPELPGGFPDRWFLDGLTDDCRLPCWNGLRVGISDREKVRSVFQQLWGVDLFAQTTDVVIQGYENGSYQWVTENPDYEYMSVFVSIDETTNRLALILFVFPNDQDRTLSLQTILLRLGPPDNWLMELETGGQGEGLHVSTGMELIYTKEVNFSFYDEPHRSYGAKLTELCAQDTYVRSVSITAPFHSSSKQVTAIEKMIYSSLFTPEIPLLTTDPRPRPIEDVLNMTPAQIASHIQEDDNYCLAIPVPAK